MYKSDLIMNAENLIKSLLDSKLIQSDEEISDFLIENQSKRDFSTYLKILGGIGCLLYTSPSPRDGLLSRMPSSA